MFVHSARQANKKNKQLYFVYVSGLTYVAAKSPPSPMRRPQPGQPFHPPAQPTNIGHSFSYGTAPHHPSAIVGPGTSPPVFGVSTNSNMQVRTSMIYLIRSSRTRKMCITFCIFINLSTNVGCNYLFFCRNVCRLKRVHVLYNKLLFYLLQLQSCRISYCLITSCTFSLLFVSETKSQW